MLEDLHWREMLRALPRLLASRLTPVAIIFILLGLAAQDPVHDVFFASKTWGAAMGQIAANLSVLLSNGFVRLAMVAFGLYLLARASHRVIRADELRAHEELTRREEMDAHRNKALQDVLTRIDELYEHAGKLPRLMARRAELSIKHGQAKQNIGWAENAIETYAKSLDELRQANSVYMPNGMLGIVRGHLDHALSALRELAPVVGIESPQWDDLKRPQHVMSQGESGLCFNGSENDEYFEAHEENLKRLRDAVRKMGGAVTAIAAQHAKAQEEVEAHLQEHANANGQ